MNEHELDLAGEDKREMIGWITLLHQELSGADLTHRTVGQKPGFCLGLVGQIVELGEKLEHEVGTVARPGGLGDEFRLVGDKFP